MPDYRNEMMLAMMSFVKAQDDCNLFSININKLIEETKENPYGNFSFTEHGVSVSCDVVYSGYHYEETYKTLIPTADGDKTFSIRFEMKK